MEIELKKVKLTKSIFEQLPGSSMAKLSNVAEVYGYVMYKGERYALAKADVIFKVKIPRVVVALHGHKTVSLGGGSTLTFTNSDAAAMWVHLHAELKEKALRAGQVFL